jgi:Fe-S-cluster-containing dehydrogenase component
MDTRPDETVGPDARVSVLDRREFLKRCWAAGGVILAVVELDGSPGQAAQPAQGTAPAQGAAYDATAHFYGMGVDVSKCIGCGRCMVGCKTENNVPAEPQFVRTWVERYVIHAEGDPTVEAIEPGVERGAELPRLAEKGILRTFFVPKLCNHCANAPCVQVCPVGATFTTQDGVVLVDQQYCIGCRYCIQACPYGARFLHPETHTAEKCTFCYHRVVRGLLPACVEVCPTGARIFGDLRARNSPLARFLRFNEIQVLKGHLNTEPKVYYARLDREVS